MFGINRSACKTRLPSLESSRHRSASVGFSRDSYGVPRRTSSEERKSGNGLNRRLSGFRNSLSNEAKGVIKETRPLNDKGYQKKKVKEIFDFLEMHNFKPSITPGKIMSPSKMDFQRIFQFLINMFDASFEVKNLEEDAVKILKHLSYPFIPNKSAFTYVARTNFANLLGILIFLMDLAKFTRAVDMSNLLSTSDSERPEEHAVVLNYIFKSNDSEESEEDIKATFEKIILSRFGENFNDISEEHAKWSEKLQKIKKQMNEFEQLKKDLEDQEIRIEKYETWFTDMKDHEEKKLAMINKHSEELKQKMDELRELEERLRAQQDIYEAQGFDGKRQLSHYEEQKKSFTESLQKKRAALKELQDECWDLELENSKIMDNGIKLSEDFNRANTRIKDGWKAITTTLQEVKELETRRCAGKTDMQLVANCFDDITLNLPEEPIKFGPKMFSLSHSALREDLDNTQKTIGKTKIVVTAVKSSKSEELTKINMKNLHLSTQLKCAASDETKKKLDFEEQQRKKVDTTKVAEKKCEDLLEQLDKLRRNTSEYSLTISRLQADLEELEKIKAHKVSRLETYLQLQSEFYKGLLLNLEKLAKEQEKFGEEICKEVEDFMRK